MNLFSKRALELAVQNVKVGGRPFGAVLTANGEIIAEGVNELHSKPDISGHAEFVAIRKAQEERGNTDLSDCTMYASGEPCPMCLAAMYFSGIKKIYYSQSVEDASRVGLTLSETVYQELKKPKPKRTVSLIHAPVKEEELDAMKLYGKQKHK